LRYVECKAIYFIFCFMFSDFSFLFKPSDWFFMCTYATFLSCSLLVFVLSTAHPLRDDGCLLLLFSYFFFDILMLNWSKKPLRLTFLIWNSINFLYDWLVFSLIATLLLRILRLFLYYFFADQSYFETFDYFVFLDSIHDGFYLCSEWFIRGRSLITFAF